jgi:hypothetical protein
MPAARRRLARNLELVRPKRASPRPLQEIVSGRKQTIPESNSPIKQL